MRDLLPESICTEAKDHLTQLLRDEYFTFDNWVDRMNHIERIKSWGLFPELVEELDREYSAQEIEDRVRNNSEEHHEYGGPTA